MEAINMKLKYQLSEDQQQKLVENIMQAGYFAEKFNGAREDDVFTTIMQVYYILGFEAEEIAARSLVYHQKLKKQEQQLIN
jgi:hypothetical protein